MISTMYHRSIILSHAGKLSWTPAAHPEQVLKTWIIIPFHPWNHDIWDKFYFSAQLRDKFSCPWYVSTRAVDSDFRCQCKMLTLWSRGQTVTKGCSFWYRIFYSTSVAQCTLRMQTVGHVTTRSMYYPQRFWADYIGQCPPALPNVPIGHCNFWSCYAGNPGSNPAWASSVHVTTQSMSVPPNANLCYQRALQVASDWHKWTKGGCPFKFLFCQHRLRHSFDKAIMGFRLLKTKGDSDFLLLKTARDLKTKRDSNFPVKFRVFRLGLRTGESKSRNQIWNLELSVTFLFISSLECTSNSDCSELHLSKIL